MAELRWHPLTQDWIMIASHRQARPQMPQGWCPFCPGSGKVPESFHVHKYDNDFPALSQNPPVPDDVANDFFKTAECYGKCEVILYSPDHTAVMTDLSDSHVRELVDLWCERFEDLRSDDKIKYVFIFENRGEVVGVTMPHPHGQIYGYSFSLSCTEVGDISRFTALFQLSGENRDCNGGQHGDDRNDDQQLGQGKALVVVLLQCMSSFLHVECR